MNQHKRCSSRPVRINRCWGRAHDRSAEKQSREPTCKRWNLRSCKLYAFTKRGTLVAWFGFSNLTSVSCVRQRHVNNFARLFHPCVEFVRYRFHPRWIKLACRTNFTSCIAGLLLLLPRSHVRSLFSFKIQLLTKICEYLCYRKLLRINCARYTKYRLR